MTDTVTVSTPQYEVVSARYESVVAVVAQETFVIAEGQQGPPGVSAIVGANEITMEAGEDLTVGTPVKITANKAFAASHETDPLVVGVIRSDVLTGELAILIVSGSITLSGLTPGAPYYLGVGAISTSAPTTGYVTRLGSAISSSTLLVNIEEPILLS